MNYVKKKKKKGGQGDYKQSRRCPIEHNTKEDKSREETRGSNSSMRGSIQTDQELSQ